jgi:uncharacterized alpha-E superfamily protein
MLSSTADQLFWLSRYVERAENTIRMLDMSHQTSMMPQSLQMAQRSWRATLEIFNLTSLFDKSYELLNHQDVLHFMCFDGTNPCSILNCLKHARDNAKAVRGSISNEVWETINTTWLGYQEWLDKILTVQNYISLYEWIKMRTNLYRGVQINTTFQDEIQHFLDLGTFLERADNMARLLDVKFYTLGVWLDDHKASDASSYADFYHWAIVLRSVSAFEVFRRLYRESITPDKVIDLMIFNTEMPRSLAYSMQQVHINLQRLSNQRSKSTEKLVGSIASNLKYGIVPHMLSKQLHAYLADFLQQIRLISSQIADSFMLNSAKIMA